MSIIVPHTSVMAQRQSPRHELDDFPTPPWATRALVEHVVGVDAIKGCEIWEPSANRGFMVRGLLGYDANVYGSDIFDYGAGFGQFDFLSLQGEQLDRRHWPTAHRPDWVITNPPFKDLGAWIETSLSIAHVGIAMFGRTQVLEGANRFATIFAPYPLQWTFAQFVERARAACQRKGRPEGFLRNLVWLACDLEADAAPGLPACTPAYSTLPGAARSARRLWGLAVMPQYPIEKGVPLPPVKRSSGRTGGRRAIYPWAEMVAGDSFFVPATDVLPPRLLQQNLTSQCHAQAMKRGCSFTCRIVLGGVRIWRLT